MKFEGSGDGSLEYVVDWESLENPSEGLEDANLLKFQHKCHQCHIRLQKQMLTARE